MKQKEIKSTVSGQVVDLQKQAIGSVIRPAEKIMDIVPRDEMLLIEAEIMPNLIDRVAVGDDVDIRFSNFSLNASFSCSRSGDIYFNRCLISGKNKVTLLLSKG